MHAHYYRVKAAGLQWQMAQAQINAALIEARKAFEVELAACELDPSKNYRLNEQTQDVEVVEPEAQPEA